MAQDELTSIPGLQDKHRKVLAEQLDVTTLQGLVLTHRQAIFDAMRRLRPRPTLEAIAEWQDHARAKLAEAPPGTSDWDRSATFVVSFEQRPRDKGVERRLAVEQTEIEPEQPPEVWPGWDCQRICRWMQDRLALTGVRPDVDTAEATVDTAAAGETPSEVVAVDTPGRASGEPGGETGPGAERPRVRIERATVMDDTGRVDVVTDDMVTSTAAAGCALPGRLAVTVTGPDPDREVHVAIQFRRPRARGQSPEQPIVVRGGGRVEFDLSHVPVGRYDVGLLAWTPDGSATPSVVELPEFTIGVAAESQAAARSQ
jgi:hypothetical protein